MVRYRHIKDIHPLLHCSHYSLCAWAQAPVSYDTSITARATTDNSSLALYTLGSFAYKNRDPLQRGLTSIQNMKWEDWTRMKDEATGRGPDGKSVYSYENMQEGLKYLSKDNVGEGMAFLSGHLEFVSALFRGVELQERLERLGGLRGVGFADLVSLLPVSSMAAKADNTTVHNPRRNLILLRRLLHPRTHIHRTSSPSNLRSPPLFHQRTHNEPHDLRRRDQSPPQHVLTHPQHRLRRHVHSLQRSCRQLGA
jgi:hypothetical protein